MSPFQIQTPSDRHKLETRSKPYYADLGQGMHLGYRKGKRTCRWVMRLRTATGYITKTLCYAVPDDEKPANGVTVLSFQQAMEKIMSQQTNAAAAQKSHTEKELFCSFCGKSQYQITHLISGPNSILICNECVALCNKIIREHSPEMADNPV